MWAYTTQIQPYSYNASQHIAKKCNLCEHELMLVELTVKYLVLVAILYIAARFVANYMQALLSGQIARENWFIGTIENRLLKFINPSAENMGPWQFIWILLSITSLLIFSQFMLLLTTTELPLAHCFALAVSFSTGTNWQLAEAFAYLQPMHMTMLTCANVIVTCSSISLASAFVQAIANSDNTMAESNLPNFYQLFVRNLLFLVLPLCIIYSLIMLFFKSPNFDSFLLFEAIKILGANGGSYYAIGSAHPFITPNNLLLYAQVIGMSLLPCSLIFYYANSISRARHGDAIFGFIFLSLFIAVYLLQLYDTNNIGRELRFSAADNTIAAIFSAVLSGNSIIQLDSLNDKSLLVLFTSMLGYSSLIGGLGTGLINLVFTVLLAVFFTSLMAGRTPQFIGKRLESIEVKYMMWYLFIYQSSIILMTAISLLVEVESVDFKAFTDFFYLHSQASINNGTGFGNFAISDKWVNYSVALGMLIARISMIVFSIILADSLANKRCRSHGVDDVEIHTPFFLFMLLFVIINDFLLFVPNYLAGPIALILQGGGHG